MNDKTTLILLGVGLLWYFSNRSKPIHNPDGSVSSSPGGTLSASDYPTCPNGTVTIQYNASTDVFNASCGPFTGTPVVFGVMEFLNQ